MPRLRNTRLKIAGWLAKKNRPLTERIDPKVEPKKYKWAQRIENRPAFPRLARMIAPKKTRKMPNATIIPKRKLGEDMINAIKRIRAASIRSKVLVTLDEELTPSLNSEPPAITRDRKYAIGFFSKTAEGKKLVKMFKVRGYHALIIRRGEVVALKDVFEDIKGGDFILADINAITGEVEDPMYRRIRPDQFRRPK